MDIILDPRYAAIVPVIVAFLGVIKSSGIIPNRFLPLLALLAGLIIGGFLAKGDIIEWLIIGGGLGASAIGVHSGIKNTLQK